MDELDLSDEEPTDAADPEFPIQGPAEQATLLFELNGWKPHVRVRWTVHGPGSWAPLYFALVLLLASASALLTSRLQPPGTTWTTVAVAAAVTGGAVFLGGAALLLLWLRLKKK